MKTNGYAVAMRCGVLGVGMTLLFSAVGAKSAEAQTTAAGSGEKPEISTGSKFYCNAKALGGEEREHHKKLTEKLITARNAIVETPRGYEFQFSPANMTIAELADWVVAEAKCCPFFYFHIDLEKEGQLLCLGLTGEEGAKAFIRTEFQIPGK